VSDDRPAGGGYRATPARAIVDTERIRAAPGGSKSELLPAHLAALWPPPIWAIEPQPRWIAYPGGWI